METTAPAHSRPQLSQKGEGARAGVSLSKHHTQIATHTPHPARTHEQHNETMSPPADLGGGGGGAAGGGGASGGASRQRFATRGHRYVTRRAGGGAGATRAGGAADAYDEQALATVAAGLQPAQLSKNERQLFGGGKMRLYLQAR